MVTKIKKTAKKTKPTAAGKALAAQKSMKKAAKLAATAAEDAYYEQINKEFENYVEKNREEFYRHASENGLKLFGYKAP